MDIEQQRLFNEKDKMFWGQWENENVLIGQRLTWLLASQTLLFAAYGIMVTKAVDAKIAKQTLLIAATVLVVRVGWILSLAILVGVAAAIGAQIALQINWRPKRSGLGIHPVTTILGWATCLALPAVFLYAWFAISVPKTDTNTIQDRSLNLHSEARATAATSVRPLQYPHKAPTGKSQALIPISSPAPAH